MAGKAAWLMRMSRELPRITFANYARPANPPTSAISPNGWGDARPGMSWRDVAWLRGLWKGPLLLKGVLHPDEAKAAVAQGIDGLIVSNHGGVSSTERSLRSSRCPRGRGRAWRDSGSRRRRRPPRRRVVKALALGASACLIAPAAALGLAVAGEAGVAHVLDILRRETTASWG